MDAYKKIYDSLDTVLSFEEWKEAGERSGELTVNTGRSGNRYAWFFDGNIEICINIETGEAIEAEQIEKEFE